MVAPARLALLAFVTLFSRVQGQMSKFWSVVSGDCFIGQPLSCGSGTGLGFCSMYLGNGYSYDLSPDADCVSTISFPLNGHYGPVGCVINVSDSAWDGYGINVDYFGLNAQDFLMVNGQKFQSGSSCKFCSDGTLTSSALSATSCDSGSHIKWNGQYCQYCGCARMSGLQGLQPRGLLTFNVTDSNPKNNYGNPIFLGPAFGFRLCPITAAQNAALPALTVNQIIWISVVSSTVFILTCLNTIVLYAMGGWDCVMAFYLFACCCPCVGLLGIIEDSCPRCYQCLKRFANCFVSFICCRWCQGCRCCRRGCRCCRRGCRCCRRDKGVDDVRSFDEADMKPVGVSHP